MTIPNARTDQTPDEELEPGRGSDSHYRISRAAVVLIAIALAVGLLIGRASVNTSDSPAGNGPTPGATRSSSVVPLGPTALQETGALCSDQVGKDLVLSIEVINKSSAPVIFQSAHVDMPLGGFRVLSVGTGACGELNTPALKLYGLPAQGTVWVRMTLRPTETCPKPYPVQMRLIVKDPTGVKQMIHIPGFKDLGQVQWSDCHTRSP